MDFILYICIEYVLKYNFSSFYLNRQVDSDMDTRIYLIFIMIIVLMSSCKMSNRQ